MYLVIIKITLKTGHNVAKISLARELAEKCVENLLDPAKGGKKRIQKNFSATLRKKSLGSK